MNDQWPRFPEHLVSHQLSESTTVGSGFSLPQAVDSDSPVYSVDTYTIKYDDPADSLTFKLEVGACVYDFWPLVLLLPFAAWRGFI